MNVNEKEPLKPDYPNSWLNQLRSRYLPAGSLRSSLASGAFWSLTGAVFSRGFTLISGIIIARLLGKEGFGLWGLIITTVSMFAQFASFGVALTATKHVAELRKTNPLRAGRTLSLVLLVGLTSVTLMAMVCFGLSGWLAKRLFSVPELVVPLRLASILLFGMVATLMLQGALAGFEDFRCIARINLIQGIVLFITAVPLTWRLGLAGTVIGMSISQCTAMSLCLIVVIRKSREYDMPLSTRGIWQERRLLWHYAAPALLTGLVTGPASTLSKAMVVNVPLGIAGLGGFTAAVRWRQLVLFIPQAVGKVTLPILSRLKGENDYRRFVKTLWANIGLNGGITLIGVIPIMILSPWILGLYGPDFRNDWDILVIILTSTVFQSITEIVGRVTASMGKLWWDFGIHIIWGILLLGGSALLVPHYGVRGYAWAFTAAYSNHMFLNTIAAIILVKRARKGLLR